MNNDTQNTKRDMRTRYVELTVRCIGAEFNIFTSSVFLADARYSKYSSQI